MKSYFVIIKSLVLLVLVSLPATSFATSYMTRKDFLKEAFSHPGEAQPAQRTLWLNKTLQNKISKILGHAYPKLRLRYWQRETQTVWFLDEIGKERPISFAVSIKDNRVADIKVLAFRESRGDEIRYQGFTQQFDGVTLTSDVQLSQSIDGITGATMSVNAMKKIARMALMLASIVSQ